MLKAKSNEYFLSPKISKFWPFMGLEMKGYEK